MPQLLAITTAGHYTETQRDLLKKDIEQQMTGFDVHVLILPPGAQMQHSWVPPVATMLTAKVTPTVHYDGSPVEPESPATDHQGGPAPVVDEPHYWLPKYLVHKQNRTLAEFGAFEAVAWDSMTSGQQVGREPLSPTAPAPIDADALVTDGPLLPPHVWLYRNMLTDDQRVAPLGIDPTNGQYAVAIDALIDAQREIPYVAQQLLNRASTAVSADRAEEAKNNA